MAKKQNFVVGSTNPNTNTWTTAELNNGWNKYQVLKSGDLDGVFKAVSDYSNDSSQEIWNAIRILKGSNPTGTSTNELGNIINTLLGAKATKATDFITPLTSNNKGATKADLNTLREEIETSSLTFKGYVATSAPSSSTYGLVEGNIWINASAMPTTFPVPASSIRVWNGTSWATTTDTYTVKDFDFFRNINDNEGYYWFGGQWVVMSTDMSTTYFTLNQTSGKWEIKSSVNLPGNPTTTTPAAGTNSTRIATTAFVANNFAKLASPAFTGTPTAPTPTSGSTDNQIATKKYVDEAIAPLPTTTYFPDLFDVKWADHICDDVQWLRADTFSWQSGAVYQAAYAHLADDITGKTLQSETISGTTIQFYLADDGHKICPASEESNVTAIYNATGVAWYYIIDTVNQRFKLPRTKFGFTGIRSGVGNYIEPAIPNIKGGLYKRDTPRINPNIGNAYREVEGAVDGYFGNSGAWAYNTIELNASLCSDVYKDDATTVQPPATEMYLYFYVGNFTQTALENTAGLNAELFNGKADVSTVAHVVTEFQAPTAQNNYTWYRKYADGWVEQGGVEIASGSMITLPIAMANTKYTVQTTPTWGTANSSGTRGMCSYLKTTTSFNAQQESNSGSFDWQVSGMAAN